MKRFGSEKYGYYKLWIENDEVKKEYLKVEDYMEGVKVDLNESGD